MNEPILERGVIKLVGEMKIFSNEEKLLVPRPLKLVKSSENHKSCKNYGSWYRKIPNFGKYSHFTY